MMGSNVEVLLKQRELLVSMESLDCLCYGNDDTIGLLGVSVS
jgi:hypothetical protein